IEWLNEGGLFSKWKFPHGEVTEVPVLDVGRCLMGTERGCTNAEFINTTLSHYNDPQYFRLCDALISVFLLRYIPHWIGWKIEEISEYSPVAAIRMLLSHLSRIPPDYRRFSIITIDFLFQVISSSEGDPHRDVLRSILTVVTDYGPVVLAPKVEASL